MDITKVTHLIYGASMPSTPVFQAKDKLHRQSIAERREKIDLTK
jgi:hypothetical protein